MADLDKKKINQKKITPHTCCVGAGVDTLIISEGGTLDDLESKIAEIQGFSSFSKNLCS